MGQYNKFRSLMSNIIQAWPGRMPMDLRSAFEKYAQEEDAMASRIDVLRNAPSESQGEGGGGSGAATRTKANAKTLGVTAQVPKAITMLQSQRNIHPLITPRTSLTVAGLAQPQRLDAHMEGYPSIRVARIADGENVKPNDAIYVENNLAYLAHAGADADHPDGLLCNAMAVRGTGFEGEIYYTRGGMALGRTIGASTTRSSLKLSVTPGCLTFSDSESAAKLFHQEVGFFDVWGPPTLGDASPTLCEFAFFPFPPAST